MNRSTFGLLVLAGLPIGVGAVYGMGCANNAEEEAERQENATGTKPCNVVDDGNACTVEVCVDEVTTSQPHRAGTVIEGCVGVCNGEGDCVKRPKGDECTIADECDSGHCTDGVCCNEACDGTCRSCNVPDQIGKCTNVEFMAPDGCDDDRVCNGKGECKTATGESCAVDNDCVGKICRGTCSHDPSKACWAHSGCNETEDGPNTCDAEKCMVDEDLPCIADADCFKTTCKPAPGCVDAGCTQYTCQ